MSNHTSTELKVKREDLKNEAKSIVEKVKAEKRYLTAEEKSRCDDILNQTNQLREEIETVERSERIKSLEDEMKETAKEVARGLAMPINRSMNPLPISGEMQSSANKALSGWLRWGSPFQKMTRDQHEAIEEYGIDLHSNVLILKNETRVDMGVGNDALGQELVAPAFFNQLTAALKAHGGMLGVCDIQNRDSGSTISFPLADDTSVKGEILTEGSDWSDANIATNDTSIAVYFYSSKAVTMSYQLLQDTSSVDLSAFVSTSLGTRINRILNDHLTTGTGSGQPHGVVTGATSGYITSPATGVFTYDNLVDFQDSLDDDYDDNAIFMGNKASKTALRKLKDTTGRPLLWNTSDDLSGVGRKTAILLNKPFITNYSMSSIGSGVKCLLYGDFKNYKVIQAKEIIVQRFNELYAKKASVAWAAWARFGGRLVNAGTNPIKYYQA